MSSNRLFFATTPLLVAALAGCGGGKEAHKAEAPEGPAVAVKTMAVTAAQWPSGYEATGTVRAKTTGLVSSKVMGYVREVRVRTGDTVQAGQVLVVLDARDIDSGYRQAQAARNEARNAISEADNGVAAAKAQLELAQATHKRMADLYAKKSISNQEFDEVSAKLKLAQASHEMALSRRQQLDAKIKQADEGVASAEVMKSYTELRAPFAGTITEKQVEPGNLAAPGAPLLTMEQTGAYRLEVAVEESMLARVRAGLPVSVTIDALGASVQGRVSEVVPSVDAASRAFTVKIDLPGVRSLRSGVFARAQFPGDEKAVLAVPEQAVVEQGQVRSVLVSDKGVARGRLVTLGRKRDGAVEVLSGLAAGEQIICPVPPGLADGAKVEVRP